MTKTIIDILNQALTIKIETPYVAAARGSNLPVCRLDLILHYYCSKVKCLPTVTNNFRGDYYLIVGNALHDLFQKWLGTTGRVFAKWYCSKCKRIVYGFGPIYCCQTLMNYDELELNDRGLTGHVDLIIDLSEANDHTALWVMDFKFLTDPTTIAKYYYELQVNSYATILRRLGFPIVGGALLGIPREAPFNFDKITVHPVEICEAIHDTFVEEIRTFESFINDPKQEELLIGLCQNKDDRDSYGCVWAGLCGSPVFKNLIKGYIQQSLLVC